MGLLPWLSTSRCPRSLVEIRREAVADHLDVITVSTESCHPPCFLQPRGHVACVWDTLNAIRGAVEKKKKKTGLDVKICGLLLPNLPSASCVSLLFASDNKVNWLQQKNRELIGSCDKVQNQGIAGSRDNIHYVCISWKLVALPSALHAYAGHTLF